MGQWTGAREADSDQLQRCPKSACTAAFVSVGLWTKCASGINGQMDAWMYGLLDGWVRVWIDEPADVLYR